MPPSAVDEPPAEANRTAAAGGTVVLIEDDTAVAAALTLLLEAEGYEVVAAASASEAHAAIRHLGAPPSLIVSDYHLADGSTGVTAIDTIRRHFGALLPAFIVTGDTSTVLGDAQPVDNCLIMNKPVDPNRLAELAEAAVRDGQVPID